MSGNKNLIAFWLVLTGTLIASCDFMFGSRYDREVDEIFEQGKIDPNLAPQNIGYVPVLPVWGNFKNPVDVYVGYDEMVYVADDDGLKILDLTGKQHRVIPVPGASEVTQDRRLHTYVIGKVTINIGGQPRILTAVYHLANTATATGPQFIDTLIHPFCDLSRKNYPFRLDDLNVEFTGLACRADNVLYVSRRGTVNKTTEPYRPDNTVLFFDENGNNFSYATGLNAVKPNLRSVLGVSGISTFCGPPQRMYGVSSSHDFLLCQADEQQIEFRVLWIKEVNDPDMGPQYIENTDLLNTDYSKADGFLYESGKFGKPQDVCIAPDQSGYIFVVDSKLHKLFIFTQKGFEGVTPPANSGFTKVVKVSFGGKGSGAFEFDEPSGVCYYKKVVYVADRNNNRIMRYKLNTDLE